MVCPRCGSSNIIKNGSIHNKKPKFQCNDCKRQFVENPQWRAISQETKNFVDKLLLEKLPLAGISRVTGISEQWLQTYVNKKYASVPQQVTVKKKIKAG